MGIIGPLFLTGLFTSVWLMLLPEMCRFWQAALIRGSEMLALPADIALAPFQVTSHFRLDIPYPRMEALVPDSRTWWVTAGVTIILCAASFLLPARFTPLTYMLRGVLLIQATALGYFAYAPARFPHTPTSYLEGLMGYAIALISFTPTLFGATYYIFDFGFWRKFAVTMMTMLHLSIFLPMQILLHALILKHSILFMPVLYIILGLPVEVLIIIGFYSWGMSWPFVVRE